MNNLKNATEYWSWLHSCNVLYNITYTNILKWKYLDSYNKSEGLYSKSSRHKILKYKILVYSPGLYIITLNKTCVCMILYI